MSNGEPISGLFSRIFVDVDFLGGRILVTFTVTFSCVSSAGVITFLTIVFISIFPSSVVSFTTLVTVGVPNRITPDFVVVISLPGVLGVECVCLISKLELCEADFPSLITFLSKLTAVGGGFILLPDAGGV